MDYSELALKTLNLIFLYSIYTKVCYLRILATSDFHGDAEAFRKTALKAKLHHIDVVVVCGDITHFGSLQQSKELLSPLLTIQCPVLFVPGNCDPPTLTEEKIETIESIHGKCKQVGNVNFLGVGGSSPSPFDTPFELTETEIAHILEQGFNSCQSKRQIVLVSHSPPKNTKVDIAFTGEHAGSISVRKFIEITNPTLVLCGHIHEATGTDKINNSTIVNPGPARHGHYALININAHKKIKLNNL